VSDSHIMLVVAGLLRRGHRPDHVARHTGLTADEVRAIVDRLAAADRKAG
jgi:hypothetical protein